MTRAGPSVPPPLSPSVPPIQSAPAQSPEFVTFAGQKVRCADVQMVVGEGGVSLDGGEMLRWKRTVVVAANSRYVSRGMPKQNAATYAAALASCPHAVGIPYKGELRMPQCPAGTDPVEFLTSVLHQVKQEMRRQSFKAVLAAIVAVVIVVAALILDIILLNQNTVSRNLWLVPIVGTVIAFMLVIRALSQWMHGQKVVKVLRKLR